MLVRTNERPRRYERGYQKDIRGLVDGVWELVRSKTLILTRQPVDEIVLVERSEETKRKEGEILV